MNKASTTASSCSFTTSLNALGSRDHGERLGVVLQHLAGEGHVLGGVLGVGEGGPGRVVVTARGEGREEQQRHDRRDEECAHVVR